ncbi:hypothetical protein COTS27_00922 [Spirochaetota bacterium]|nr:hypothetical protein COTS27_00922 [Spirochaetota bacterium]
MIIIQTTRTMLVELFYVDYNHSVKSHSIIYYSIIYLSTGGLFLLGTRQSMIYLRQVFKLSYLLIPTITTKQCYN